MSSFRKAFAIASAERYIVFLIVFATTAILGRLLTPHEIGLSVIGTSAVTMAEALRDFGTGTYLVQKTRISRGDARTVFVVMLLIAGVFSLPLAGFAAPIADAYGQIELAPYLQLIAAGILIGPFFWPIMALLRREMAFKQIAIINITWAIATCGSAIVFALLGFSYMSLAWGGIFGSLTAALLTLYIRPFFWIYVPSLQSWREVFTFGRYSSIAVLAERFCEASQFWLIGRILNLEAVGLFSRGAMLASLPDKLLFSGIGPVALPALAAQAREGRGLQQAYLEGLAHTTVVQWPALILIACLADPLVRFVLGEQWVSIVPLVQILALARLLSFPLTLSTPVLVAVGQIRHVALVNATILPLSLVIFGLAATISLSVAALTSVLTIGLQALVTLYFVRLAIPFPWKDVILAVRKSAIISLFAAIGPIVLALTSFGPDGSVVRSMVSVLLAGVGWCIGIWGFRHPMRHELTALAQAAWRGQARPV